MGITAPIPGVAALASDVQDRLLNVVRPRFNDYFAFTAGGDTRAIAVPEGHYVYPRNTMNSDLSYLGSLFSDIYETLGGSARFADLAKLDDKMLSDVAGIVGGVPSDGQSGSFWQFPAGRVSLSEATGRKLGHVLRTLRNGFAHSHWHHADLSAIDYWREVGWSVDGADPRFNLEGRPSNNYVMYIADALHWDPARFWSLEDLRILVTPSHVLRYHLHLLLNYMLNGSRTNVFDY